jgi:hypothetical protein
MPIDPIARYRLFLWWAFALVGVVFVSLALIQSGRNQRFQLLPGQSQLMQRSGSRFHPHDVGGFLDWAITETKLWDGKKRLEGIVRWNALSGAEGAPVCAMPIVLYLANPAKKTLTPIAHTVTDDSGRFVIDINPDAQTLLGGEISRAKNIPEKVRAVLESPKRPATPSRIAQKRRI